MANNNGAPVYSVGVPTVPPQDTVTNDANSPPCRGECAHEGFLRERLMGVGFECPSFAVPGSATAVSLCSAAPVELPALAPAAWSAHANVWVYQAKDGRSYPVWQQDHGQPGEMPCPNGKLTGSVVGSTHRLVANTSDLDKYGRALTAGGTGPDPQAPLAGEEYVYVGTESGNSMAGRHTTDFAFQISNDPNEPFNGGNAWLTVKVAGYGGPYHGYTRTAEGVWIPSTDASGNWIPASSTNYWQANDSPVATAMGTRDLVQLFTGTVYDTGWEPNQVPAHYGLSAGLEFQAVLDYSACA